MAICIIGGYPFLISACREEILEIWKLTIQRKASIRIEMNVTSILLLILSIAVLVMQDAAFVIGCNGAVIGSALVYVCPSLLFLSHTSKLQNLNKRLRLERWFCPF